MVAAILASQYSVQTKSVCEHHKNDVSDPELSLLISDLQKGCVFNNSHTTGLYDTCAVCV